MPVNRPQLVNDQIYHLVARGIEGRNIFDDTSDYSRALRDLFDFNDENPAGQCSENGSREMLIEIMAYCLMPNHIHLLVRQIRDGGITKFMRKFGAGYAGYFNKKHNRQGYLFQGRFRAVAIKNDAQLKAVFVYIHTNPASLIDPKWKDFQAENGSREISQKIIELIENYEWSSYFDYLSPVFPENRSRDREAIIKRDFLNSIMNIDERKKIICDWVFYKKGIEAWNGVDLDY